MITEYRRVRPLSMHNWLWAFALMSLWATSPALGGKKQQAAKQVNPKIGAAALNDAGTIDPSIAPYRDPDGRVIVGNQIYQTLDDYIQSDFYKQTGKPIRCGTVAPEIGEIDGGIAGGGQGDCAYSNTNPAEIYDPSVVKYRITVVVHVIRDALGNGHVTSPMVQSQIDVLNEDFLALTGTLGEPGTDTQIEFVLATQDQNGNPHPGITYSSNSFWYNDQLDPVNGYYYNALAWNPHKYLNIYTLLPEGAQGVILGYVPFFPQDGPVGSNSDRVVILSDSFGRPTSNSPYHYGRTTTHEVGHYLGLFHTFQACDGANCATSGDRVCDTNSSNTSHGGCPGNANSCGSSDPYRNYMEYTDDLCMNNFTPQQTRRMRCTLEHWRSQLAEVITNAPPNNTCATAESVGIGTIPFTTIDATTEGPDEAEDCNFGGITQISNDVWYKFTPLCDGTLTASLCNADFDSKLAIYEGCPIDSGLSLGCSDDDCGDDPVVSAFVSRTNDYRIRVGGVNGATGDGDLVLSFVKACNADIVPTPCGNLQVNVDDLLELIGRWGESGGVADLDFSGLVSVDDLLLQIGAWGPCP